MLWQIHGDARHIPLADESVQCVVTSPPYYGLRNYQINGQIGLEKTHLDYADSIVQVFQEVRRVLTSDGTVWLNIGDSFASGKGTCHNPGGNTSSYNVHMKAQNVHPLDRGNKSSLATVGLKPKDLIGIPWRVAFALQADGWYLRSDIIWAKPNPMPESVTDRPTRSHEYLFLLTKSARYFYNAAAIRTPAKSETRKMPDGWDTGSGAHGAFHRNGREKGKSTDKQRGHSRRHNGFNDRCDAMEKAEQQVNGANARSVWWVATQGTPLAHFATFPEALVRPCILAGSHPGDLVLDPFAGTGTVGKVALEHGRKAVMIDLNYDYLRLDPRKRQPQIGMGL